jgi:hypothetical protein
MTHAVAGGQAMREKVLEAFDLLRIQEAAHRRLVDRVRAAVERSEPFSSYDDYVEMASRLLSRP